MTPADPAHLGRPRVATRPAARASRRVALFVALACGSCTCDALPGVGPTPTAPDPSVVFQHDGELERHLGGTADVEYQEIQVQAGSSLVVTASSSAFDPVLHVTPPGGATLTNDDFQGSREHAQLAVSISQPGRMQVWVTSYERGASGRYRLLVRAAAGAGTPGAPAVPAVVMLGQSSTGELGPGDAQLPDGRWYEQVLVDPGGATAELTVQSTGPTPPVAIVLAPAGHSLTAGPTGAWALAQPGVHRVQLLSAAAGQGGGYTVGLAASGGGVVPTLARTHHQLPTQAPSAGTVSVGQSLRGSLEDLDARLPTGEPADVYQLEIGQAGQELTIELSSSAFDPYLMLVGPTGRYWENDDNAGALDSALVLTADAPGTYRVVTTAYRADERGAYELKVQAGARAIAPAVAAGPNAPATPVVAGAETRGTLAQGDQRLQTGEWADYHTMRFAQGESVRLRLASSSFDPYLIVRAPSGRQEDNDDLDSSTRDSGLDVPAAEAGDYTIIVTSYEPGEAGPYVLTRSAGVSVPRPVAGGDAAPATGGRVFGLFAGISDYPPGQSDLAECANDAVKLSEALRTSGLLTQDGQVLLTDAQATLANVRSAMARMASMVGPQDIFVFFWSGHGGQNAGSRDPREIDGTDETLLFYDGEMVDDEMGRLFDAIDARIAVVAIDSCHAGGFAKDLITRPGRVGLFSSEEDVLSAVASQFQAGGYLSHFLRVGVAGEADADPRDGVLTVGELTHHLYTQFGAHARDVHLASAHQHLVVDRGAVRVDQVLWSYR